MKSVLQLILLFYLVAFALPDKDEPDPNVPHYSRNFILKGFVTDGRHAKDTVFCNKPLVVYAFNRWYSFTTGPKGEYEVNFADTTGWKPASYWSDLQESILFGWGEDPNFTHTQSLKKLKIKKIKGEEKFDKPPRVIKLNVRIRFEYED